MKIVHERSFFFLLFTENVSTTHSSDSTYENMPIPCPYYDQFSLLLVQEVQFQFPEVTSLLFPEYFSSQKPPLSNNMNQKYYTGVAPQLAPASAKKIDPRRSLSPVKEMFTISENMITLEETN